MICPNCAANISETAKVCGYCGTRLPATHSVSATPETKPVPETAEPVARAEAPTAGTDPAAGMAAEPMEKPVRPVADVSQPAPTPAAEVKPVAVPDTVAAEAKPAPPALPKGSLRWFAGAGLVVLVVLAVDLFGCSFGLHELVSGVSGCKPDLASFWMFVFIPALLLLAMMWLGSSKRSNARLALQALLAAGGIAMSVWAIIFNDASYYCSGTFSGGPYPESDSTFCAFEWSREGAYVILGLVFLAAFIGAAVDRRRRRRLG